MDEYLAQRVKSIVFIILFILCTSLVAIGHRAIGHGPLLLMVAGLAGDLALLYIYNKKYK